MAETVIGMGKGKPEKVVNPKIKELESKLADETSAKENALAEKVQLEKDVTELKGELDKANKKIKELKNKSGGSKNGTDPKGSAGGSQEPSAQK